MQFNNELHEQLFALFIAEFNSATYQEFGSDNSVSEMQFLIDTIRKEYQLMWLDKSYHEPFYSEVIRIVKGNENGESS